MKHLGDITRLNGAEIPPVDVITFGSPCQDLSTAGNRAGLEGSRSNLFLEAVRIIEEMRKATNGEYPTFAVWENVPGAFSSKKGADFYRVLQELVAVCDNTVSIPRPAGKWLRAGEIMGNGYSLAWRTMDAQYWGVPQHRRRIALVVDFGGCRASQILFDSQGVCGDFAQGGAQRKGVAGTPGQCTAYTDRAFSGDYTGGTAAVQERCVTAGFDGNAGAKTRGIGYKEEVAPTLCTAHVANVMIYDCRGYGNGTVCQTLTGDHQNRVTDYTAICIQGNIIDRADTAGCNGAGYRYDASYTLNTVDRHAVCMATGQANAEILEEQSPTLNCNHEQPIAAVDCRNFCETPEIRHILRRITPLECERLQGYPDGWTDIPTYIDKRGKPKKTSDSQRYKALGNSIALPQWRYVMGNISRYLPVGATLGSLFDGIGGFPLVWQEIHGPGTAVWASEIEPFPIAVTQYHFGED